MTTETCPFAGAPCELAGRGSVPYVVRKFSNELCGLLSLTPPSQSGSHLVGPNHGQVCPRQGLSGSIHEGTEVLGETDNDNVLTFLGPTAVSPCVELNPWGRR